MAATSFTEYVSFCSGCWGLGSIAHLPFAHSTNQSQCIGRYANREAQIRDTDASAIFLDKTDALFGPVPNQRKSPVSDRIASLGPRSAAEHKDSEVMSDGTDVAS